MNQTQQKPIIKWLNTAWRAVGTGWIIWIVIGSVSDIFFLNPTYYWIHEMIFERWSDVGIVLLVITIITFVLNGGLIILYRKRRLPELKKAQQELPKR